MSSEECRRTALCQDSASPPTTLSSLNFYPFTHALVAVRCSAGRASHTTLHIQPVTYRLQAGRAFREPTVTPGIRIAALLFTHCLCQPQ